MAEHKLEVALRTHPIRQKLHPFRGERREAVAREVAKLREKRQTGNDTCASTTTTSIAPAQRTATSFRQLITLLHKLKRTDAELHR